MSAGEREREVFNDWGFERDLDYWQESIAFSLWQINKSLEKLTKTIKEKQ
jgi:hypothetical protein